MDLDGYINLELTKKPVYDNPVDGDDAENYPIIAANSYENPTYTKEIHDSANEKSERCDIPYQAPKRPLGHAASVFLCLAEIVGIFCIVVTVCWILLYRGGMGWENRKREFNGHPIFMVVGLVFFYSNAALSSYVLRNNRTTTVLHVFHLVSVIATIVMTAIGFAMGIEANQSFYSFHSWLGLLTLVLFTLQVVIGFAALFPKCEDKTRKKYLKFQIWVFMSVFVLTIVSCITGISNYLTLENVITMTSFSKEELITNILQMLLFIYGMFTCGVLLHPVYRMP